MSVNNAKPFFDQSGNLVIPPVVLGRNRDRKYLIVRTSSGEIEIVVKAGEIVSMIDRRKDSSGGHEGVSETEIQQQTTTGDEMLQLAQSSMEFWDNPVDDEVWNNA